MQDLHSWSWPSCWLLGPLWHGQGLRGQQSQAPLNQGEAVKSAGFKQPGLSSLMSPACLVSVPAISGSARSLRTLMYSINPSNTLEPTGLYPTLIEMLNFLLVMNAIARIPGGFFSLLQTNQNSHVMMNPSC